MMTPAQAYLARKQRRRPPIYFQQQGRDRAQQLYDALAPGLPSQLRVLVDDGVVAIGEVGRYIPDLATVPIKDDGFVIEFTTGMMDFPYAVGRAMAGAHVEHNEQGLENEPATDNERVVKLVQEVFAEWKRLTGPFGFFRRRRIQYAEFPIDGATRQWIETIATQAETFTLAHELGHVALNRHIVQADSANTEENADRFGLDFYLQAAEARVAKRIAYVAPIFALLLFDGLQRIGVRFSAAYPPQQRRIELIRAGIRSRYPSDQAFYEAITTAVAYQDMIDDVIRRIRKESTTPSDPDRILVRVIAELIEAANQGVPIETFKADLIQIGRQHSDVMQTVADKLIDYYGTSPDRISVLSVELRAKMGAALAQTVDNLPPDVQRFFGVYVPLSGISITRPRG